MNKKTFYRLEIQSSIYYRTVRYDQTCSESCQWLPVAEFVHLANWVATSASGTYAQFQPRAQRSSQRSALSTFWYQRLKGNILFIFDPLLGVTRDKCQWPISAASIDPSNPWPRLGAHVNSRPSRLFGGLSFMSHHIYGTSLEGTNDISWGKLP